MSVPINYHVTLHIPEKYAKIIKREFKAHVTKNGGITVKLMDDKVPPSDDLREAIHECLMAFCGGLMNISEEPTQRVM
jgi:hypothetical protein